MRSYLSILLSLLGLSTSCLGKDPLAPFLNAPAFETQRLFKDQRYPNVVVTIQGTVLAVWGNDGVVVRLSLIHI